MASRYANAGQRPIRLRHPVGGLDRAHSFQDQPPYTTPDCLNVFPVDALNKRGRIAQRPGLKLAYAQQLGSGNPVRMLCPVTRVLAAAPVRWSTTFDALPPATIWDTIYTFGYDSTYRGINGGGVRTALDINTANTTPYTIEIDTAEQVGIGTHGATYSIYFRVANSGPSISATGVAYVKVTTAGSSAANYGYTVEIREIVASVDTLKATSGAIVTGIEPSNMTVRVTVNSGTVDKKVVVAIGGTDVVNATLSAANSSSSQRTGLNVSAGGGRSAVVTAMRVTYTPLTPAQAAETTVMVASSNGQVYADNPGGSVLPGLMTAVTQATTRTLATDRRLMAVDMLQKLYIADNGNDIYSGTGLDASSSNINGGPDWTTLGISTADHVAIVTNSNAAAGQFPAGTYLINSIGAGNLGLRTGAGATISGASTDTVSIRIVRAMKYYDPSHATQQLSIWMATTGKGAVPHGSRILCQYNDRIVAAGDPLNPTNWQMSHRSDPYNWNFGESDTDNGRAIAGTDSTQATIGQPITALVPLQSDYLLIAGRSCMYMMRGDPGFSNAGMELVSNEVGIIDSMAWCATPEREIVFLSLDGVWITKPGAAVLPQPFSRRKIPSELINVDTTQIEVSMRYISGERGILLCLRPKDGSQATFWWLDEDNRGVWPITFPAQAQPCIAANSAAVDPTIGGTLFGCADGYIRKLSRTQFYDDVPALSLASKLIPSRCAYGPFGPAGTNNLVAALLDSIEATLSAGSGAIQWSVYAENSAEELDGAASFASGTWNASTSAYRTLRNQIRARGGAFKVVLSGADTAGTTAWSVESLDAVIDRAGPIRV